MCEQLNSINTERLVTGSARPDGSAASSSSALIFFLTEYKAERDVGEIPSHGYFQSIVKR